ncbi:NYN domain-containing protein [Skermanella stibiiresistens]|uniref:NYN domain-containing protein n=1 Tax=Skermanella stibiiresistens TaxID=913326 RepID=UPI0004AD61EF|nr:NYN domain-containing protein [Skermanella stibiiresistens]
MTQQVDRIKTAVFVDFDNVYLSLLNVNPQSAERFATDPLRWLKWLESGSHEQSEHPAKRAILIRRCYLNPSATGFGNYRAYFSRNAFSVIDCPPVTARGKNSADIVMVMDILDTLTHTTRIDEFIILSADADFMPVLLRLRAHDRQTTIWSRFSAAAYRAACDFVIDQNVFVEQALGIEPRSTFSPQPAMAPVALGRDTYTALLPRVAGALVERARSTGPIASRDVHEAMRKFPQFTNSSWFGFGNLRSLVDHLCHLEPGLECRTLTDSEWRLEWRAGVQPSFGQPGFGQPGLGQQPAVSEATRLDDAALRTRIMDIVRAELRASDRPVSLAALGQTITRTLGHEVKDQRQWAGHGTFKSLILANGGADIGIDTTGTGFAFDRSRMPPQPAAAPNDHSADQPPDRPTDMEAAELQDFIGRIASITDIPPLSAATYGKLFALIGEALAREPFQDQLGLESQVAALCADQGLDVDKASICYVVTGLAMSDFSFTTDRPDPGVIARVFMENAIANCANAQLPLADRDRALFSIWLTGATWRDLQSGRNAVTGTGFASTLESDGFPALIQTTADMVLREVRARGTLTGLDLVEIVRRVNTRGDRSWFGCGNLRILVERIIDLYPEMIVDQPPGQPWGFVLKGERAPIQNPASDPGTDQSNDRAEPMLVG